MNIHCFCAFFFTFFPRHGFENKLECILFALVPYTISDWGKLAVISPIAPNGFETSCWQNTVPASQSSGAGIPLSGSSPLSCNDEGRPNRLSQAIVMRPPSLIDVIKRVRDPLLLQHAVPFLTDVQGLSAPKVSVFLPMCIEIYRAPKAEAMASNNNDDRSVDQEENSSAGSTVLGVQYTFTVTLLFAAEAL